MSIAQRLSTLRPASVVHAAGQRVLHPFRPDPAPMPPTALIESDQRMAATLLRDGLVSPHGLIEALAYVQDGPAHRLIDVLLARNLVGEEQLFATLQRQVGIGRADLAAPFNPNVINHLGPSFCLAERLLPLRRMGLTTLIAEANHESFVRHQHKLADVFGEVLPSLAPASQIEARILPVCGPALTQAAETTVALNLSCRTYRKASPAALRLWGVVGVVALVAITPLV